MTLDERMNEGLEHIIAQLQAAKAQNSYFKKAQVAQDAARQLADYAFYWDDKLNDWLMDAS